MNSYSAARDSSTPRENDGPSSSPSFSSASMFGSSGMKQPSFGAANLARERRRPRCAGTLRDGPEHRLERLSSGNRTTGPTWKGAPVADDRTFVIVGASLAGAKAAEALRDEGFEGRIVLIGSERHRPYERPPLTKGYLRGEDDSHKLYVHDEGYYDEHGIELLLGRTATGLDTRARTLTLDDGATVGYDRLLLATGAEPRVLDVPGATLGGVHYLRTIDDADALRGRLEQGGHGVVVIGSGWIGAEIAASARQLGNDVTMISPEKAPLERVLGSEVGAVFRDLHRENGVQLLLGTGVEAIEGTGAARRVRTADGSTVDC